MGGCIAGQYLRRPERCADCSGADEYVDLDANDYQDVDAHEYCNANQNADNHADAYSYFYADNYGDPNGEPDSDVGSADADGYSGDGDDTGMCVRL